MITEIYKFNRTIIGVDPAQMVLPLDLPQHEWLTAALKEEIQEFEVSKTEAEKVDALIDLCYFAIGGLARLGLSEEQAWDCFDAVHEANMTKRVGIKETRPNDGSVSDAVKDETFKDPVEKIGEIISG